jgi:hypothetical protein
MAHDERPDSARTALLARRGVVVATYRKKRELSQAGLAGGSTPRCDQSTISGIERGHGMSTGLTCRLAVALDLEVEDLLAWRREPQAEAQ